MAGTLEKINICFDHDLKDFLESDWRTCVCLEDKKLNEIIKEVFADLFKKYSITEFYNHICNIEFIYNVGDRNIGLCYNGIGIYDDKLWDIRYGTDTMNEETGDTVFNIMSDKEWAAYITRFKDYPDMPKLINGLISECFNEHSYLIEHCGICYWM